jgi:ATP-binding cassette subfamily G (WHITE) protein 2
MNTLALRLQGIALESGEATINGAAYRPALLKRLSGYVIQDDLLFPHSTVEETLLYSAALRMPQDSTSEERRAAVEDVIERLGLQSCRNTIVGSATVRGTQACRVLLEACWIGTSDRLRQAFRAASASACV